MALAVLDVIAGVGENIGSSPLIVGFRELWRRASGAKIKITSPKFNGLLENPQHINNGWFYEVQGHEAIKSGSYGFVQ